MMNWMVNLKLRRRCAGGKNLTYGRQDAKGQNIVEHWFNSIWKAAGLAGDGWGGNSLLQFSAVYCVEPAGGWTRMRFPSHPHSIWRSRSIKVNILLGAEEQAGEHQPATRLGFDGTFRQIPVLSGDEFIGGGRFGVAGGGGGCPQFPKANNPQSCLVKQKMTFKINEFDPNGMDWPWIPLEKGRVLLQVLLARAHGMWTYEPRQGRKAATVVCSVSAVVTLVLFYLDREAREG